MLVTLSMLASPVIVNNYLAKSIQYFFLFTMTACEFHAASMKGTQQVSYPLAYLKFPFRGVRTILPAPQLLSCPPHFLPTCYLFYLIIIVTYIFTYYIYLYKYIYVCITHTRYGVYLVMLTYTCL